MKNDRPAFPYKPLSEYEKGSDDWQAMRIITIIQRAFDIGTHEAVSQPRVHACARRR